MPVLYCDIRKITTCNIRRNYLPLQELEKHQISETTLRQRAVVWLLMVLASLGVASFFGLVYMVAIGLLTKDSALTLGYVITTLLAGLGLFKAQKKD